MTLLGIVCRRVGLATHKYTHTHTLATQPATLAELNRVCVQKVLAELKLNTQSFTADKESFSWTGIPISARISTNTHRRTDTHTGFVISRRLTQPSILHPGWEDGVTSLQWKKAFYSFCQLVSDWLVGESGGSEDEGDLSGGLVEDKQGGGWQVVERGGGK